MELDHLFDAGLIDVNNIEYITQGLETWINRYDVKNLYMQWFERDYIYDEELETIEDYKCRKAIHIEDDGSVSITQHLLDKIVGYLDIALATNKDLTIEMITNRKDAFVKSLSKFNINYKEEKREDD